MYTQIIVPLDGSEFAEQVLPYALALAPALGSEVQLVRAVQGAPPAGFATQTQHERFWASARSNALTEAEGYLKKASARLEQAGVKVAYDAVEGPPAGVIVEAAESVPQSLIAMTTHGRSGPGRWLFGSVADRVLHTTTRPLLAIRSRKETGATATASVRRIVLPLDGSELAETAVPHAVAVAKALHAGITAVQCVTSVAYAYGAGYLPPADAQTMDDEAEASARAYLEKAVTSLRAQGVNDVDSRMLSGQAAESIVDFARSVPDHLVVLATHGWSGITRAMMGSVAGRLVRHSEGPVLIVPPRDVR